MVITTSKRAYLLDIKSVKISPVRIVRWTYPTGTSIPTGKPKELGILPDPDAVTRYHVGYVLQHQGRAPDWMPRGAGSIVDDGKKLYVLLPITTLYTTAPMVRALGVQGARLVNVRAYLNVLIIDELAERPELRVGTGESAEVVTITRGEIHTIECPTSAECPHWPPAAQTLARRQP